MDQILIMGIGDTGIATVASAAKTLISSKVRVNSGRICCTSVITKDYSDYMAREGVISAEIENISAALDTFEENENGRLTVVLTAALDEVVADDCINVVKAVKSYFSNKDLYIDVKGLLVADGEISAANKSVLSDMIGDCGYETFDNIYLVKNESQAGLVYPDKDSIISTVSRIIYLAFVSSLSSEFYGREKNATAKDTGKTSVGLLGYSKAAYLYENVAQYCGLRGAIDVIHKFWLVIDNEIAEKHSGRALPAKEFRKAYISSFEKRVAQEGIDTNYFPTLTDCIYNETVTLNDDDSENCTYTHKVEDFVTITERLVDVYSNDVAFNNSAAFCINNVDEFIKEMNEAAKENAARLMVNAVPLSANKINAKNDASLFGLISNEKGDIPEERVYSNPVAARYLFYKLSDHMTEMYYSVDLKAVTDDLKAAFISQENKEFAASKYLNAVTKLAFINQFNEKLERFIRQFEDFFAGIPSVREHFESQLEENLAFEGNGSPSNISIGIDPEIKDEMYNIRSFPLNGNPPVGPQIITMVSNLFFWGEDAFDNVNATLAKSDPVYSFEYHIGASFKKYYTRDKDVTVTGDIYHACGFTTKGYAALSEADREKVCDKAFANIVESIIAAATPVGFDQEPDLLWTVSPMLMENCPKLGEFIGEDPKKYESRSFDKTILECVSTVYDIDPEIL